MCLITGFVCRSSLLTMHLYAPHCVLYIIYCSEVVCGLTREEASISLEVRCWQCISIARVFMFGHLCPQSLRRTFTRALCEVFDAFYALFRALGLCIHCILWHFNRVVPMPPSHQLALWPCEPPLGSFYSATCAIYVRFRCVWVVYLENVR